MNLAQEGIWTDFSDQAPIWIIPLEGTSKDLDNVMARIHLFLPKWTSHGRAIQSKAAFIDNRFLVITGEIAGGGTISGCAIDNLIHTVEKITHDENCHMISPFLIHYRNINGGVECVQRSDFENMISQGKILPETKVFNSGIQTLKELRSGKFEQPLADSVYAEMFKVQRTAT